MADLRRILHASLGLLKFLTREATHAVGCLLQGKNTEAREHLRFALQGLHEDLASLAASRARGAPLPARDLTTRILIVKLDRVGDMVNTAPVFDFLHAHYPQAQLDIVGHPAVLALLDEDPRIAQRLIDGLLGVSSLLHFKP